MAKSRVARAADPARFSMEKARGVARRMAAALPRMSGAGDFYREMGHLYAIAERACETVLTAHRPSAPLVCRKGCPYCCRVRVEVTVPEVLYMAEHLRRKLPPGDRKALAGRMDDVRRRTAGADEQGWVLANAECPFLVDDCCWVHPVRPFACRSVTSMDIDGCRRFYERRDPAVRISQYAYQRQIHTACEMGLVSGVDTGFPDVCSSSAFSRSLTVIFDVSRGLSTPRPV